VPSPSTVVPASRFRRPKTARKFERRISENLRPFATPRARRCSIRTDGQDRVGRGAASTTGRAGRGTHQPSPVSAEAQQKAVAETAGPPFQRPPLGPWRAGLSLRPQNQPAHLQEVVVLDPPRGGGRGKLPRWRFIMAERDPPRYQRLLWARRRCCRERERSSSRAWAFCFVLEGCRQADSVVLLNVEAGTDVAR